MPDNTHEPILPIPSDLDQQTYRVQDAIEEARRQVIELHCRYTDLAQAPDALRTDTIGADTTPTEATNGALMWLESTNRALFAAQDGIGRARNHTSRLSLTEQACDERDQRIADREAAFNRRRDIRRVR
ncbi:hypothetical protein AB0H20_22000 [Nocardia fluminea]|uniref:hypothetical protein n=1 Tax=Nocardia fluminea TaxID=134984 RepID=UPI0033E7A677